MSAALLLSLVRDDLTDMASKFEFITGYVKASFTINISLDTDIRKSPILNTSYIAGHGRGRAPLLQQFCLPERAPHGRQELFPGLLHEGEQMFSGRSGHQEGP